MSLPARMAVTVGSGVCANERDSGQRRRIAAAKTFLSIEVLA